MYLYKIFSIRQYQTGALNSRLVYHTEFTLVCQRVFITVAQKLSAHSGWHVL